MAVDVASSHGITSDDPSITEILSPSDLVDKVGESLHHSLATTFPTFLTVAVEP